MRISVFVLVACTSTSPPKEAKTVETPPPAQPEAKPEPEPEPDPEVDPARWACVKDEDCRQTCGLGAVNAAWLAAHPNADQCDDGCGWKSGKEACRDGECVTLDGQGGIDEGCTRVEKHLYQ